MAQQLAGVDTQRVSAWLAGWLAQEISAGSGSGEDSEPPSPLLSPLSASPPAEERAFQASRPPAIGIPPYLERLVTYADPGLEAFLMLPSLVSRLKARGTYLTSMNVHRMCAALLLLAAKLTRDSFFSNIHFAKVAGVRVQQLNDLEIRMFALLDFRLHTPTEALYENLAMLKAWDNR